MAIGMTLGDPSGVGPQLVAHTLTHMPHDVRSELRVFGHLEVLERAWSQLSATPLPRDVTVVAPGPLSIASVPLGRATLAGAHAQVQYLEAAVVAAAQGELTALVTAPISKRQVSEAGWRFRGHTEFLADRLGADSVAMMFVGPRLKVVLATVHIPVAEVAAALTPERLQNVLRLTAGAARETFHIENPRIGVVGLNPHAGEAGLLGTEERDVIGPAIQACASHVPDCHFAGPLVPDVAFRQALEGQYDVVVAMYHDQGLIPVKLIDFERSVNLTLGLPIVRTSPDHGVAYDIAGTRHVRTESFDAAVQLAVSLSQPEA